MLDDDDLRITSPTYLLSNAYDGANGATVHHFDLYRLSGRKDLSNLNIPAIFPKTVSLIEWPDRLGEYTPDEHISLDIDINNVEDTRVAHITLHGSENIKRLDSFRELELLDFAALDEESTS